MSVQIPINASSTPVADAGGVHIPIGNRLQLPRFGASREEKIVRAVAAASALEDPAEALRLAKQAVEDPATVAEATIERPLLDPVLAQLSTPPTGAGQPTPEQIAAARAADVDPALVAVAQAALKADTKGATTTEAREWVATIEPSLLERAARAGLRQKSLEFVPKTAGTVATSRLDDIEKRLKALEEAQTASRTTARTR